MKYNKLCVVAILFLIPIWLVCLFGVTLIFDLVGIQTFGPVIVGIGTEMHLKKNDGNRKRGMPLQEPEFRYASNGLLDTTLNVEPMVYKAGPLTFHTRTYEGKIPGPTLVISSGDILKITLNNTLEDINNAPPQEPLFNVPAEPNSTNLHTHGFMVSPEGHADNILRETKPKEVYTYTYNIMENHPAGMYWYHPHAHGSAAIQKGGGMAGIILIKDDPENVPLELAIIEETVLIFQIIILQTMKQTLTPWRSNYVLKHFARDNLKVIWDDNRTNLNDPEYNLFMLTNGQFVPKAKDMHVNEIRRFKMVNAGNTGIMEITIEEGGCEFHVLAYDGVYRRTGIQILQELILYPATRVDFLFRCSTTGTKTFKSAQNEDNDVYLGKDPEERVFQDLLTLDMKEAPIGSTPMKMPTTLPSLPRFLQKDLTKVDKSEIAGTYELGFSNIGLKRNPDKRKDATKGVSQFGINGGLWSKEKEIKPRHCMKVGSIEDLVLDNTYHGFTWPLKFKASLGTHPFHIHVNHFQTIDANEGSSLLRKTDERDGPKAMSKLNKFLDKGNWRDTFPMPINRKLRIRYPSMNGITGRVILHCHIGTHSGQGMITMMKIQDDCTNFECIGIDCWKPYIIGASHFDINLKDILKFFSVIILFCMPLCTCLYSQSTWYNKKKTKVKRPGEDDEEEDSSDDEGVCLIKKNK